MSFWEFSLQFYARPRVAAACIEWQDRCGADVNVLLYLLFLADQGRMVSREDVTRIDASVRPWREEIVAPLRLVRRALKHSIGSIEAGRGQSLRTEIKRVELEAERLQQETLEHFVPATSLGIMTPSRIEAARANLAAYAAHLGEVPDALMAPLLGAFDGTTADLRR
jgi:uncharacterized protein (TIGR02444 family)